MTSRTRRRTPFLTALAVLAVGSAPVLAGKPDVTAKVVETTLSPGETGLVVVEMRLGPGWHVNDHKPLEEFLVPTVVTLKTSSGERLAVKYPKGELKRFAFSEAPLSVYAGAVRFEADLPVPPGTRAPVTLSGEVSYQACNAEQCFPPARIPLGASLGIR
jgi:DsbC/DsbD-like thiol-disulfide interchange protein